MNQYEDARYEMTLDPPGRIAVVGAGPLGIEAALYGRYLGYDVIVFEKGDVGQSLRADSDAPLPMLPDRCLSPLALSAIEAQGGKPFSTDSPPLPLTVRQWLEDGLERLVSTDLLRGRIETGSEWIGIETRPVDLDETGDTNARHENTAGSTASSEPDDSYIDGDVPADYVLTIRNSDGVCHVDVEAVIVAMGASSPDAIAGYSDVQSLPYLFRIGSRRDGDADEQLLRGWHDIVEAYAILGGRPTLDLYRPRRS